MPSKRWVWSLAWGEASFFIVVASYMRNSSLDQWVEGEAVSSAS